MFAKIKSGCAPDGLVDYVNNELEKDARLIDSDGVLTTNNKAMAASFALQSKSNPKVHAFVGHTILAFSPEDRARMSDDLILEIAKKYMAMMGIVDTQYAIFRHYDRNHDHIHIVYNRVDNNGKKLRNDKNFKANIAVTQKLTREYGLTLGQGKEKVNRDRLKGRDRDKYRFYDDIKPIVKEARNWSQFKDMLKEKGYDFIFRLDDDEEEHRIKGISFSNGKTSFSGRQLDRSLTYFSIDRQLNINASRETSVQSGMENVKSLVPQIDRTSSSGGEPGATDVELSQEAVAVQLPEDSSASSGDAASAIEEAASDINAVAAAAGETIAGVINIATSIHPSAGGGGGGSSSNLDDDKDKKRHRGRRR